MSGIFAVSLLVFLFAVSIYALEELLEGLKERNKHLKKYYDIRKQIRYKKKMQNIWKTSRAKKHLYSGKLAEKDSQEDELKSIQEELKKPSFWSTIKNVIQIFPSPIALLDHMFNLFISPVLNDSISEFLLLVNQEASVPAERTCEFLKSDLNEKYQLYCFIKQYKPKDLSLYKEKFQQNVKNSTLILTTILEILLQTAR